MFGKKKRDTEVKKWRNFRGEDILSVAKSYWRKEWSKFDPETRLEILYSFGEDFDEVMFIIDELMDKCDDLFGKIDDVTAWKSLPDNGKYIVKVKHEFTYELLKAALKDSKKYCEVSQDKELN